MAGPYIHYNYKRYLTHGLSKDGGEGKGIRPEHLISMYHKMYLSSIQNSISKNGDIKTYEMLLNGYYNIKNGQIQPSNIINQAAKDKEFAAGSKYIEDYIQKHGGVNIYQIDSNLKVTSKIKALGVSTKSSKSVGGEQKINFQAVKNRIDAIIDVHKQLVGKKGLPSISQILQLKNEYERTKEILINENKRRSGTGNYALTLLTSEGETLGDFANKLNNLILAYNALGGADASKYLQGGAVEEGARALLDVFEAGIQSVVNTATEGVIKSVKDITKYAGGSSAFTKDLVDFMKEKDSERMRTIKGKVNGVSFEATSKFGKGDLLVTKTDESTNHLSIKGYTLGQTQESNFDLRMIGLLSGSNVLQLLDESPEFTMHYLNIVPLRYGKNSKNAPESTRKEWHGLARAVLAARGLIGQIGTEGVPCLAVKNVSTGNYKCYSTKDLVEKIYRTSGSSLYTTGEFDDIDFIRNQWVKGAPSEELSLQRQIIMEQMLMKMKVDIEMANGFLNL